MTSIAAHQTPPDLRAFFAPASIAIVGASADPASISGRPLRLLQQHGYPGAIYPVNPRYRELRGVPVYPSIGQVLEPVELAIVLVPAPVVPGILEECATAGVRFAMVISSGFSEAGSEGRALQEQIKQVVAGSELRVCGPNCEGFFNLPAGVPAGFSPTIDYERGLKVARSGPIGVVAQSGGVGFALLNRGLEQGLGFSVVISTGNEVDLESLDYVDYLIDDPGTRVILTFVEGFRNGRRLIETARKAAEAGKPLVVAKVGRSEVGRRSAASHTGSLAGSDEAYEAAFRQLGVLRAEDLEEMLDLAAYFSVGRLPAGRRVAVLTPSGGAGTWLADACAARGLELPTLEADIQAEIAAFIPSFGSTANPVDITAGVIARGGLEQALELLCRSERVDAIAVITTLAAEEYFQPGADNLRRIAAATDKALLYYSYTTPRPGPLETLGELGIPCYGTPGRAARALGWACWYRAFLDRKDATVLFGPARTASKDGAQLEGPLTESEARARLAASGLPAPREGLARSADEAVELFRRLDGPVALKVQSPDLPHKTDVGGVRLGVMSEAAVREAYGAILAAVGQRRPQAEIRGVLVQEMVTDGVEVILGARADPDFGPLVLVGLGGIYVEVLRDVAIRLAPVSASEARMMIDELRGAALLRGARGRPAADLEALIAAIVRFSELAADLTGRGLALEINPLLIRPEGSGVVMLDATIVAEATSL